MEEIMKKIKSGLAEIKKEQEELLKLEENSKKLQDEAKKIEDVTPLHEETIIEDNTKTDDDFENDIIPNFLENKN